MLGRTTRLEFIIVTVAFLVLLLCSKPPRPGTADVELAELDVQASQGESLAVLPADPTPPVEVNMPQPVDLGAPPPQELALEVDDVQETRPADVPVARQAVVDARRCEGLDYGQPMKGEITVRWVWDGQKLVPQKVCEVKEANGVTTVWRFDPQGKALLAEIEADR